MNLLGKFKERVWSCPLFREVYILLEERNRFSEEARERFAKEKPQSGSYIDYKDAFWKHRVTYSEYMYSYEFFRLTEEQRNEFISTSEMQCIYRKFGDKDVRNLFHDKVAFLNAFHAFVHRKWALAKDLSLDDFQSMLEQYDCIAKPIDGTRGHGISKLSAKEIEDWGSLYTRCVEDNLLLEQCVQAYDEIAEFHPSSLNTIRVVTISNNGKSVVFGALFRMGAHGSVIDNTHAGGVYAPINVETGTIEVDAIDSMNNHFLNHPDTGKPIKGFVIPKWKEIIETCKKASAAIPDIHFAGWDLCVTKDGFVEIIEGNHAPDFDGGMQAPLKMGVKKKLRRAMMDVMGIDPLPYVSIWRNCVKK